MRHFSGWFGRTMIAGLLLTALLVVLLAPGQAETTQAPASNQTGGKPDQPSSSLVQCDIGLMLPLLLAGLVTLGGSAKANRKK
jgi:hypothetical protein